MKESVPNDAEEAAILHEKGRDALVAGEFNDAVKYFKEAIARVPHFKSLELLGEALMRLECYKDAIVPLAAATTLNRQVRAPSFLAEAFYSLGSFIKAYEIAQLALQRDPTNRKALFGGEKYRSHVQSLGRAR